MNEQKRSKARSTTCRLLMCCKEPVAAVRRIWRHSEAVGVRCWRLSQHGAEPGTTHNVALWDQGDTDLAVGWDGETMYEDW